MKDFLVPFSVKPEKRVEYLKNISLMTGGSGNLFLIAGDQKVEHLNDDFYGAKISLEDNNPEHLFKIAAASEGGVLATHLGLISKYGKNYRNLPYIVKINGKTNLNTKEEQDSSKPFWKVENIVDFKKQSGLKIVGIGYTVYLGGKYEAKMLAQAAKSIFQAHQAGLAAIIWIYPRGKDIKEEDVHTIAGAAGVAACLDADFIKVKYPYGLKDKKLAAKKFKEVTEAAGRAKIICVGGSKQPAKELLAFLNLQLEISKSSGLAIGRNLHQRPLEEAVRLARAISALIIKNVTLAEAEKIFLNKHITKQKTNVKFLVLF
jgi:fructose-bisphosphate aldolase/6-deoxy-5-ketofructose 1-phosphate synthase